MSEEKRNLPEITVKVVILGVLLAVVLAGANAYLGLFAGMTVSASIPAAVISMGIFSLFKRSNVLENNLVQTAASAGESVAAGVIFTIPALVMMGYWKEFDYIEVAKIAGLGGIIGVLFTIPLRRALIVEGKLKFPEGVATAVILKTGDKATHAEKKIKGEKTGMGLLIITALAGGIMKLASQGFQIWGDSISWANTVGGAVFGMGSALSPALVAVGYIVGRNIAILIFLGGLISWVIAIPVYTFFYGHGDHVIVNMSVASEIWSSYIRYLGVGTMVVGGVYSIFKLIKPLRDGIRSSLDSYNRMKSGEVLDRTEKDIPIKWIGILLILSVIPLFLYFISVLDNLLLALLLSLVMLIFGFLFSAVAGYMAGLVGSSNNPVSGITIATIVFTSILLLAILGTGSLKGAAASIILGAVICCAAAIAGDNLQDLKAGHILGATPWKQQIMQMIGTAAAAITMGLTLDILHTAYVIGSDKLSAPQATLMKSVAEGVFKGGLPWGFVGVGAIIGVIVIIIDYIQEKRESDFRVPVLAVAVGIYLPITLSVPIFIGGMVAHYASKFGAGESGKKRGLLFASGIITGEALMGIIVAIPIFIRGSIKWWPTFKGHGWIGVVLFLAVIIWLFVVAKRKDAGLPSS